MKLQSNTYIKRLVFVFLLLLSSQPTHASFQDMKEEYKPFTPSVYNDDEKGNIEDREGLSPIWLDVYPILPKNKVYCNLIDSPVLPFSQASYKSLNKVPICQNQNNLESFDVNTNICLNEKEEYVCTKPVLPRSTFCTKKQVFDDNVVSAKFDSFGNTITTICIICNKIFLLRIDRDLHMKKVHGFKIYIDEKR